MSFQKPKRTRNRASAGEREPVHSRDLFLNCEQYDFFRTTLNVSPPEPSAELRRAAGRYRCLGQTSGDKG